MQPGPIALALTFAAALLFAEHMAMWDQPWRIDAPWSYVLGVATLAASWIVWGLSATGPVTPIDAVASIVLISAGGGAVVVVAYAVRGRLDRARKQTAVVTQAKALTQDLIDQGERHAARESDLRDPSRRN